MPLYRKSLNELSLDDLKNLIADQIYESKHLEYKSEFNISSDRTELLNDLTAMANGDGGDIVFGINEKDGLPISLNGVSISNIDEHTLKIENVIRDNVSPRFKYDIKHLVLNDNEYIIIIRIPKSTNAPHMVTLKGQGFYIRNLSGKHKMDINELRESFLSSNGYSKETYLLNFKDELIYNQQVIQDIKNYLTNSTPLVNAFDPIDVGSRHFRLEAWNTLIRAGILPILKHDQYELFQKADRGIRTFSRIIQMENADWKRILEFNPIQKMGESHLIVVHSQIKRHIEQEITKVSDNIKLALEVLG